MGLHFVYIILRNLHLIKRTDNRTSQKDTKPSEPHLGQNMSNMCSKVKDMSASVIMWAQNDINNCGYFMGLYDTDENDNVSKNDRNVITHLMHKGKNVLINVYRQVKLLLVPERLSYERIPAQHHS